MAMLQHCIIVADSAALIPVHPVPATSVGQRNESPCFGFFRCLPASVFSLSASTKDALRKRFFPAQASFFLMGHFLRRQPSATLSRTLTARQGKYASTSASRRRFVHPVRNPGSSLFSVRIPECVTEKTLTDQKNFLQHYTL